MTYFENIKEFTLDQLAIYLHNIEESTIKHKKTEAKSVEDWKYFLSEEIDKK